MNIFMLIVLITCGFATVCLTTEVSKKYSAELKTLPEEGNYKASGTEYKKSGMEPLFDFARSFIRTSLPGELPLDFINSTISGELNFGGIWSQVQKNFLGFVVAIFVGVLFFVLFPIVGCCFCCCRCYGKCGSKSNHEFAGKASCHRLILSSALLIFATFSLVGNICTYVSNERMTTGLEEINSNAVNNLDDINTFLNLTEEQVIVLGHMNLNITWNAVISQMDISNLTDTLSDYITEKLAGSALAAMKPHIQKAQNVFAEVENAIAAFKTTTVLCNLCRSLDSGLTLISNLKTNFDGFTEEKMSKQIAEGIKTEVNSSLKNSPNMNDMKLKVDQLFKDMYGKVNDVVVMIKKFRQETQSGFDVDSLKRTVTYYSDQVLKYNKYRSIAGSVLSAILTLVISLLILGVIFGFFGNTSSSLPTNRGCVSHTGSRMLMASVVFIFIFSPLLMLLTTLSFAIGAPLQRYVCQGLDGPNYDALKVVDNLFILPGLGTKAKLLDIVRSCKEGKTAYVAFQLENSTIIPGFNMTEIKEKLESNKREINTDLNHTLNITMNTSRIAPTSQLKALDNLKDSITNVNVGTLTSSLNSLITAHGLPQATINPLIEALNHLDGLKNDIPNWKSSLFSSIQSAQTQLSSIAIVSNFTQDVFGIVDQYVSFAFDVLENKLGKCTPLWNMYNSLLIVSVCKYTIDAFNGFWFSMGWCLFFFMPGIILAVKLEKHFRRMNSVGPLDDSHSSEPVMEMKHNA
ncbi:hypothetical protein CHS0354_015911 [Potamilus streckersoni]|uniref:Prominin-like protein n=1 Tax=Potamilus streckersoni TaxID=2493646 RepID=A0AAE0SEM0_9BIVA|nr:hypothetical protein CHS0354_015911 [Potamilus streckersoni]